MFLLAHVDGEWHLTSKSSCCLTWVGWADVWQMSTMRIKKAQSVNRADADNIRHAVGGHKTQAKSPAAMFSLAP